MNYLLYIVQVLKTIACFNFFHEHVVFQPNTPPHLLYKDYII